MQALVRIDPAAGIAAMQSINRGILRSAFIPLFFGTTAASLLLALWGLWHRDHIVAALLVGGGVIYLLGMASCTVFRNIPLNSRLDRLDPGDPASWECWLDYIRNWTRWNHLRTLSSTLASLMYMTVAAL